MQSGSNLFDFTGEVATWCRGYEANARGANAHPNCFILMPMSNILHRFEGNVNYAQISPRHLEAAAARSAQVLYEGDYSGIPRPE